MMIQQAIEYLCLTIAFAIWMLTIYKSMIPSRIIYKEAEKRYKDLESESYAIICYRPQDGLKILWTRVPGLGVIGFHTKEEAKVAIEKGGETRILKYLFGVEV